MRSIIFAKRTAKEILRDPLTFLFCLGFPILMLVIMTIVNQSIPEQAGLKIFQMESLAPGIVLFGFTFIMLFTCMQVAGDRSTALLIRLYASPMKSIDFVAGYTLPILVIAILQSIITFGAALIVTLFTKETLQPENLLFCLLPLLPAALLFLGLGMLFGTILGVKAAPGVCSILISVVCMLGGIWMDIDALGGGLMKLAHILPFYQAVKAARMAVMGRFSEMWDPLFRTAVYGLGIYLLAVGALRHRMKKDIY